MQHIKDPLLEAYIDGFCNEERINEVEAHVDACDDCRERLESARAAAQRASALLGTLDPGPVHAPSFEELQARAAARVENESVDTAAPVGAGISAGTDDRRPVAPAAVIEKSAPVVPLWRRPAMAWAATLVIAFGLGWLSRPPIAIAPESSSPAMSSADGLETEASAMEQDAAQEVGLREGFELGDQIDDLQPAAKRFSAREPVLDSTPRVTEAERPAASSELPTTAAVEEEEAVRRQEAQNQAVPPELRALGAGARGAATATPPAGAATPPPPQPAEPPPAQAMPPSQTEVASPPVAGADEQMQFRDANYSLDRPDSTFADAGQSGEFVPVSLAAAEAWLGAPPRQLPNLTPLRVEVAPGSLAENGILSRNVVRLVYRADTGQQISLMQQYTGPLEEQEPTALGQVSAGRAAGADTPARLERRRADAESPAELEAKVDADRGAVVGGLVDLPATVRDPDGTVTYRWRDAGAYVLAISGDLDPDVLRGLADLVR